MNRQCNECTLCCKLLPVKELKKPADTRCKHQRHNTGCSIYARRPMSCRVWSCTWLKDPEATRDLRRPDRTHYVIDTSPDYVTITYEHKPPANIPVLQVWVDARYPDAYKDPALLALIDASQCPAVIRYSSSTGFVLFPPSITDGKWEEKRDGTVVPERTPQEIFNVLRQARTAT